LQTDTAVYFLSVNTSQAGFRYTDVTNNVAGNSLPVEPYFMYTYGNYYWGNGAPNPGYASLVGVYVYSSSYDQGEFFASGDIYPGPGINTPTPNLYLSNSGPSESTLKFGAVGDAVNPRNIRVLVNGTVVKDTVMDYFNDLISTNTVSNSNINSNSTSVQFINTSANSTDRMQVSFFELTYPRDFNFGGQTNFKFELPAKSSGYFLQISNFTYGSAQPVLYDLKNGERYVGDIAAGKVQFALPGSATDRQMVLVNEESTNITTVTDMTSRTFTDYSKTAAQGDYIIISNPLLYTGSSGNNPVEDYRAYRASTAGGGHAAIIADINELTDQFAFGIKKHPLSIRNFLRYARAHFSIPVKNIFLMGRGVNYSEYQYAERNPTYPTYNLIEQLNLIPTFGYPGSDNLLSAEDLTMPVAGTPIGRLSVVSGKEIEDYLEKVKEYESVQANSPNTIAGRGWMKNIVHITGSSDAYLGVVLCNYMDTYRQVIG
jgi:hypothetical protein